MCCTEYKTIFLYLESFQSLYDKIKACEAIELKMLESTLSGAGTANYAMYELDDGQVRVKTNYRSPVELAAGIVAIKALKQGYINEFNGSRVLLRAGAARNKGGYGRCC